jgi:hypothetical protein
MSRRGPRTWYVTTVRPGSEFGARVRSGEVAFEHVGPDASCEPLPTYPHLSGQTESAAPMEARSPSTGDGRPSGIRETGRVGGISQPEVRRMAGSEAAPRDRLSLGRAVGQGWALWLAGFLALAGGVF